MDFWILCYIYKDKKGQYGQAHHRAFPNWKEAEVARSKMRNPFSYWVCKVQLAQQPG